MTLCIPFILGAAGLVLSTVDPQQGFYNEATAFVKKNLMQCADRKSVFSYLVFYLTSHQLGTKL